jgi:hypothetical protein
MKSEVKIEKSDGKKKKRGADNNQPREKQK